MILTTIERDTLKIAAISDLHILPNEDDYQFLDCIRERVEEIDPDIFVIAGDISDYLEVVSKSLEILKGIECSRLYVPGNHDIWFEDNNGPGSLEKYTRSLDEICQKYGFTYLPNSIFIEKDTVFIGSIGWYDYSFRRPELEIPDENYIQKEYHDAVWYDAFKIDWDYSDIEATDLFNRKLQYDLETLPSNISQIVYISHHLPFRELTIYKNRLPWDFYSAFMGSAKTGDILLKDKRIVLSISGHSHVRNMISLGNLTALTVPVGYCRPSIEELEGFVKQSVATIEMHGNNVEVTDFTQGDLCDGLPYINSREF